MNQADKKLMMLAEKVKQHEKKSLTTLIDFHVCIEKEQKSDNTAYDLIRKCQPLLDKWEYELTEWDQSNKAYHKVIQSIHREASGLYTSIALDIYRLQKKRFVEDAKEMLEWFNKFESWEKELRKLKAN